MKKRRPRKRQDWRKIVGLIAELRFWAEALRRGLVVSRPDQGGRYDFVVDSGCHIYRVQVKSTSVKVRRVYYVHTAGMNGRPYSVDEIDFIAVYVIPENDWYLIPVGAIDEHASIYVGPDSEFAPYRAAWHRLLDLPKELVIELKASVETAYDRNREALEKEIAELPEELRQELLGELAKL